MSVNMTVVRRWILHRLRRLAPEIMDPVHRRRTGIRGRRDRIEGVVRRVRTR